MNCFGLNSCVALLLLTSSIVLGENRCPATVAPVRFRSLPHSHIGIDAKVNGSGPYEFMVDTGAQITVVEPALAEELKLKALGSLNVVTVASNVEVPLVSAAVVEVGPVSVQGLQMAVEDLGPTRAEYSRLRGILGNNFLSRFDLLIDNSHKMLCFDDSRRMQESLRGERVAILLNTDLDSGSASVPPVLVSVHLTDDGPRASVLRLDSGSNVPLLYADRRSAALTRGASPVCGRTIGKQAKFSYAYTPERNARLGAHREMEIAFATPIGTGHLYSKSGEDGVLPTTLFKRVFISTAGHFVMFDPR